MYKLNGVEITEKITEEKYQVMHQSGELLIRYVNDILFGKTRIVFNNKSLDQYKDRLE